MRFIVKKKPAVPMKELIAQIAEAKKHEGVEVLDHVAKVANSDYVAVFRIHPHYGFASGDAPDQHEGYCDTKQEALIAARAFQIEKGRDPNFILDLTNVDPVELGEFLR